jgi:hypothetical protein
MTCVVGVAHAGGVWVGADSAGIGGEYRLMIRLDGKVFHRPPFVMGFTSSFRMGQLLRYSLKVPHQPDHFSDSEYLATTFVDAVRQCLKDGGFATKTSEAESGGIFIVGYRGRLYTVEADYQVAESVDSFVAIGSGDQVAHGSLCETAGIDPVDRVRRALEAAERFSAVVRAPFRIVASIPAPTDCGAAP